LIHQVKPAQIYQEFQLEEDASSSVEAGGFEKLSLRPAKSLYEVMFAEYDTLRG
jgi:hypothetical protein